MRHFFEHLVKDLDLHPAEKDLSTDFTMISRVHMLLYQDLRLCTPTCSKIPSPYLSHQQLVQIQLSGANFLQRSQGAACPLGVIDMQEGSGLALD